VAFATELQRKIVCESFLGNILWCIDREAFPIVPVIPYHHHRWRLVTFRSFLSCSSRCPARIIPFAGSWWLISTNFILHLKVSNRL
jgi:hypothetical protein